MSKEIWIEKRGAHCMSNDGSLPSGFSVDGQPFVTDWVNSNGTTVTCQDSEMDVPPDYATWPVDKKYIQLIGIGVLGATVV